MLRERPARRSEPQAVWRISLSPQKVPPVFLAEQSPQILAQAEYAAAVAGLRYVSDEDTPGISRARHGTGFTYRGTDGKAVRDSGFRRRVAALAIPPAWTEE